MRAVHLTLLLVLGCIVATQAWEEWMFPAFYFSQYGQRQNAYYPPSPPVYAQPVDSTYGWRRNYNAPPPAPAAPVRDARWYDNNT